MSSGGLRPPLTQERWITYHYTGVYRSYALADVPAHMRHLNHIWRDSKLNEYNYVIGQREDDLVFEFAGKYAGAHSLGENFESVGVYFLNGINEPLTETQIRKAQWLRDKLKYEGTLRMDVDQRPHRWMPGAQTACPGDVIMSRLTDIVKPYRPTGPTPLPPYIPAEGEWGLWPHVEKRAVRRGDVRPEVEYLNDVLRLLDGHKVCGSVFEAATERAVRTFQSKHGLVVDGWVGRQTWPALDRLTND